MLHNLLPNNEAVVYALVESFVISYYRLAKPLTRTLTVND